MKRHRFAPDALIEVLHTAQELFGFLQNDILHYIAHGLKLPPSRVYGVATFYHFFSFAPKGKHTCVVCTGTACYVKGADALLAAIERDAGDDRGQDVGRRAGLADDGPLPGRLRAGPRGRLRRRGLRQAGAGVGPGTAERMETRWISLISARSRDRERAARKPFRIRCCGAASCLSSGSKTVLDGLEAAVADAGLGDRVQVSEVGCMRLCCEGPLVQVDPDGPFYQRVAPARRPPRSSAALDGVTTADAHRGDAGQPFFARQLAIVLENSGLVEPERIESYIEADGYQALYHVLREMNPAEVVEEITRSGLRGRGGAGFPTGLKWETVAKQPGDRKFVVCNADEGDPGAFMDRSVLESDPHRVLEGMAIAGYAIGASQGFIYVRAEYPLAVRRLETAIKQAKRLGLLGSQIFDSPFDFELDIRIGAGAFVCGEETALIHSIEGKRGVPRPRPPYPTEQGLWGMPTLINNVETFANVPPIIRHGADWFAGIGTEKSKGTKVFALAGKIRNTGLVEVPMGTTLRQIVEEIGGGVPEGTIKAVQTGGPSGGCIPAERLDTPVDYESLTQVGSIMGSGGMIVMDEDTCMVDVARFFMDFCMDESCGKCIPCRAGTVQMHRLLTRIGQGLGSRDDLCKLEALCDMVKHTSLCGLGQSAPNPVLSTLRYFRHEYEALIKDAGGMAAVIGAEPAERSSRPVPGPGRGGFHPPARWLNHGGQDTHNRRQARRAPERTRRSSRRPARPASRFPTLCHLEGASDVGACRLCLVELGSTSRLVPACVTHVAEEMVVRTDTDAAARVPANDRRAALRRAQPRLLGLRGQQQLRVAGSGGRASAWTTSAMTT